MDDRKLIEDSLAQDAMSTLILQARKDGIGITDVLWDAGYRLDHYPNGKSKDELITRIKVVEAERDKARNLLRQEHDKVICKNWLSGLPTYRRIHEEREPDCPVCAFLDETSLVKP